MTDSLTQTASSLAQSAGLWGYWFALFTVFMEGRSISQSNRQIEVFPIVQKAGGLERRRTHRGCCAA